jgi:hypothetical protein
VEEFEDAINDRDDREFEDAIFAEPVPQNRLKYLSKENCRQSKVCFEITQFYFITVEDHCEEEILGCLQFTTNYRDRYGHGPDFFEGTLEDAVKAACSTKSAKDVSLN